MVGEGGKGKGVIEYWVFLFSVLGLFTVESDLAYSENLLPGVKLGGGHHHGFTLVGSCLCLLFSLVSILPS
ncbi:hypothetical protein QBC46DRAFT_370472 [Diplogelasinospora grovesii]|uniref:Uncharacterized protein n=1 Tax=Diplogelasinospora grovesii TaxID=303347 RepID=A0AAN6SAF9_9PEZI|nr:hypothetical protein QBC46DRAFT_370472 [Diplogelasinospora grovesii]